MFNCICYTSNQFISRINVLMNSSWLFVADTCQYNSLPHLHHQITIRQTFLKRVKFHLQYKNSNWFFLRSLIIAYIFPTEWKFFSPVLLALWSILYEFIIVSEPRLYRGSCKRVGDVQFHQTFYQIQLLPNPSGKNVNG